MNLVRKKDKNIDNVIYLNHLIKKRARRLKSSSEEERKGWEKAYRKSKLLLPYFMAGIILNIILILSGFDFSRNLVLGAIVGPGVPMAAMFLLSELHYRIIYEGGASCLTKGRCLK